MSLSLFTAPTLEPLTLGEACDHLRLEPGDDDATVEARIVTVRRAMEKYLGRALVTQTWDWKFDFWPCRSVFRVPLPPLQSVASIKYIDVDGAEQTWATTEYQVDANEDGGRIALAYGKGYPALRCGDLNAVTVRFVAGYGGPEDVPDEIKAAMLIHLAALYENREPTTGEMGSYDRILIDYKLNGFGA